MELAITACDCITAVGHDAPMTAASVRAGVSRFFEFDQYPDREGNPVTVACISGISDGRDTVERMGEIVGICLGNLLAGYFGGSARKARQVHLFLGVASEERPGPRYGERCRRSLREILEKWAVKPVVETLPMGNASCAYALAEAGRILEKNPDTLCIVGAVDSMLRASTLDFFEHDGRLKSATYGRHQGLIAGEAVSFMVIEDPVRAGQSKRPVLARVTGIGLSEESDPRASGGPGRGTGLTESCRVALTGRSEDEILAVFGDLNGENSRAVEWCMAEKNCFQKSNVRKIWTPANCYGDIGAASGAVMTSVAAQGFSRKWLQGSVLVFCTDDHGSCGAMVLDA